MDKLKYVKLKRDDGSYSDSIPLSVEAQYIDIDGETLTNKLNSFATKTELQAIESGSPAGVYATAAALISANPDHSKIYLVTENGCWYYYNTSNSSWTSGGIYQSTGFDTDKKLTTYNMAADAEKTGDEITKLKAGDTILNTGNYSYADSWNSVDIVTYAGGASYDKLKYTHKPGTYGIELLPGYDPTYGGEDWNPYFVMNTAEYIPFDKNKKITFKAYTNVEHKACILYRMYDENHSQVGSAQRVYFINGTNEIITTRTDVRYLAFYNYTTDKSACPQKSYVYDFVSQDKNYENLNTILTSLESQVEQNSSDIDVLENKVDNNSQISLPDSLLYRKHINNYYFDSTEQTPIDFNDDEYLNAKINAIPKGKHFIFITDTHWEGNAKKSIDLLQYVRGKAKINNVIHGGDVLDKKDNKYLASSYIKKYMNQMVSGMGNSLLQVLGNHDLNTANITAEQKETYTIPYEQAFNLYMKHLDGYVHFCNQDSIVNNMTFTDNVKKEIKYWLKMNYYYDDNINNIRYIILNTGISQLGNGVIYDCFRVYGIAETIGIYKWLSDILKTVPNNYSVVLAGHMITNAEGEVSATFAQNLFKILDARKNKTSTQISVNYGTWQGLWDNATMGNIDYSNMTTNIDKVLVACGHWHYDKNTSYLNIPCFVTQCDAYGRSDYEPCHEMTLNTITEQCFDVITLTDDNRIVLTRFGAGEDRDITI